MSNSLDVSVISMLKAATAGETVMLDPLFTRGVVDQITNHPSRLTVPLDLTCFETEITGKKLAPWIQPLNFEKNLNSAIDALEIVDRLLNEQRQTQLIKIQQNFIKGMLSNLPDHTYIDNHNDLSQYIDTEDFSKDLALRFSQKMIDLIEYTKAAKLGAELLFGIKPTDLEFHGGWVGISKIRESLRKLLEIYRQLIANEQEEIIPISLKKVKNDSDIYLVKEWHDDGKQNKERGPRVGLCYDTLKFDLTQASALNKLKNQRIRRLGIQIIDATSLMISVVQFKKGEEKRLKFYEDYNHPNFWSITLSDESSGFPLGKNAFDKFLIEPIKFSDVAGSRNTSSVSWSRYDALINFNPNRLWKMTIQSESHRGVKTSDIRDIILHIHIAHL